MGRKALWSAVAVLVAVAAVGCETAEALRAQNISQASIIRSKNETIEQLRNLIKERDGQLQRQRERLEGSEGESIALSEKMAAMEDEAAMLQTQREMLKASLEAALKGQDCEVLLRDSSVVIRGGVGFASGGVEPAAIVARSTFSSTVHCGSR